MCPSPPPPSRSGNYVACVPPTRRRSPANEPPCHRAVSRAQVILDLSLLCEDKHRYDPSLRQCGSCPLSNTRDLCDTLSLLVSQARWGCGRGRGPESSSGDGRRVIQVALTHEIAVRTMVGVVRVPPDSARIRLSPLSAIQSMCRSHSAHPHHTKLWHCYSHVAARFADLTSVMLEYFA